MHGIFSHRSLSPHSLTHRYSAYRKGSHVCEALTPFGQCIVHDSHGALQVEWRGTYRNLRGNLWNAPEIPGSRPFCPPCVERTRPCMGYFPTEALRRIPSLAGTVPTGKGPTCVRPSRLSASVSYTIPMERFKWNGAESAGISREITGMLRKFLESRPSARLVRREPSHAWDIFPPKPFAAFPDSQVQRLPERVPRV